MLTHSHKLKLVLIYKQVLRGLGCDNVVLMLSQKDKLSKPKISKV